MVVEKNIPIPPKKAGDATESNAIAKMKVGDSVLALDANQMQRVIYHAKRNQFKVTTRQLDKGTRVWRVA
jgi:hypothetical protein